MFATSSSPVVSPGCSSFQSSLLPRRELHPHDARRHVAPPVDVDELAVRAPLHGHLARLETQDGTRLRGRDGVQQSFPSGARRSRNCRPARPACAWEADPLRRERLRLAAREILYVEARPRPGSLPAKRILFPSGKKTARWWLISSCVSARGPPAPVGRRRSWAGVGARVDRERPGAVRRECGTHLPRLAGRPPSRPSSGGRPRSRARRLRRTPRSESLPVRATGPRRGSCPARRARAPSIRRSERPRIPSRGTSCDKSARLSRETSCSVSPPVMRSSSRSFPSARSRRAIDRFRPRGREPELLPAGSPGEPPDGREAVGERLLLAGSIHDRERAAVVVEDRMLEEGDEAPVRRDARMADPARRLVERLSIGKSRRFCRRSRERPRDSRRRATSRPSGRRPGPRAAHAPPATPIRDSMPVVVKPPTKRNPSESAMSPVLEIDEHVARWHAQGARLGALRPGEEDFARLAVPRRAVDDGLAVGREPGREDLATPIGELVKRRRGSRVGFRSVGRGPARACEGASAQRARLRAP